MRRSASLAWQVFLAALAVALLSVVVTGLMARTTLARAFETYLGVSAGAPMGPPQRGLGMVLGVHEQAFMRSVDQGIIIAAVIAVALAAVGAFLLARYLARPLGELTEASQRIASGDLGQRVEVEGPAEVERLGEAFNEMASSLGEAEALGRRLVGDVAHELRNPVAALRAQVEGMSEGVLEVTEERLSSIVEDTTQLSRLVDDLQELSVAEAGRLRYEKIRFDVGELVARERERAEALSPENVRVGSHCPAHLYAIADERRIAQVVRNLLSNALRHTEAGEVDVVCAPSAEGVSVSVRDTGEGISEEDLPYIFERFYRADAARAKGTGGTGIGLAISKRIIEDHGGRMFATSELGKGSTVGFFLPDEDRAR